MKNLKVYMMGTAIVLISGITGLISGIHEVDRWEQEINGDEAFSYENDSQTSFSVKQPPILPNTLPSSEGESSLIENSQVKTTTESGIDLEFQYFNEEKNSLKENIMNGDIDSVVEVGKRYIALGKDFIYNGTEIHGVTFDQLTEQGKQETLNNLAIIDGWIMAIDSDYKSQIEKGMDTAKNLFEKAKEKVKSWVGGNE